MRLFHFCHKRLGMEDNFAAPEHRPRDPKRHENLHKMGTLVGIQKNIGTLS